jgi:hypothetical protein
MKRIIYLTIFSALLLHIQPALAAKDTILKPKFYGAWTLGSGILFCPGGSGPLYVSFPYTSKGTANTFSGTVNKPFSSPNITGYLLCAEFGTLKNFFTCYYGASTVAWAKVEFGTGYNFYIDLLHNASLQPRKKPLVIKPFVNVCFTQLGGGSNNNSLYGNIDNTGTTITAFGLTASPTYTYTSGHTMYTNNAKVLDVNYVQNDWILIPGIGISNNPFVHLFHIGITLSYYYPFSQRAGIQLSQDGSNSVGTLLPFGISNLTATFNGKTTLLPYLSSGFYLGITVGVSLPGSLKYNTKPSNYKDAVL